MKLPSMKYPSGIKKVSQLKFAGLERTKSSGEGSLWDMQNLCSDHAPVLATRGKRMLHNKLAEPKGLFAAGGTVENGSPEKKLCFVDGNSFFYDGVLKGQLNPDYAGAVRTFAELNEKITIFPDKKYYDIREGTLGDMEAKWQGAALQFLNGTIYGEAASANTLYAQGAAWENLFQEGDAVEIAGCTLHPENNKNIIVREIEGDYLRFYENSFKLEGENGDADYTEQGNLSIARTVPALEHVCEHENRLWGCDARTIYVGKLGDIFNWNVFDGLESDCWQWEPGSSGNFTGCISYRGYPIFFKEDCIIKVYGSLPSEFQALGSATLGVADNCHRSLVVAGETLFYLSRNGITAYQGGIPQLIGQAFGAERYSNAVAGSDGMKYYVSMEEESGRRRLYVYDTQTGLWHIEDDTYAISFTRCDGELYCLAAGGELWSTRSMASGTQEEAVRWWAEFGDITEEEPNKKGVSRLHIRLELEEGATAGVWIQYDSDGQWKQIGKQLQAERKRSFNLPVIPRRCDHYRLKLEGVGQCYLHSIAREYYVGSER